MHLDQDQRLRLGIIGGGLTGAALMLHIIRASRRPLRFEVVEPAADIGRGTAYGTTDPAHRINVPTDRMSLFPDDRDHLTRWLHLNGVLPDAESTDASGYHYVPRSAYGAYVNQVLTQSLADAGGRVEIAHHRTRATALEPGAPGWTIRLQHGSAPVVDRVALCSGHAAPALPCRVADGALAHRGFVRNPWAARAFAPIGRDDRVLVVGTGLTMADAVASLVRLGHAGPITAISRRSLLARPHGLFADGVDILDGAEPPATAMALLRLVRRRVGELEPLGWQPVVDALRYRLPEIWTGLPSAEQVRVARRLLPFWEVHRFRIAPQLHDLLERERGSGRLRLETAGLANLDCEDGDLVASLRRRGGAIDRRRFDAVVLCTGPGNALRTVPLLAELLARRLAKPDTVGLGLATDQRSRLLDPDGIPQPGLWALGPITRGSFGEMTGAPDIVRHVERIAADLVEDRKDQPVRHVSPD